MTPRFPGIRRLALVLLAGYVTLAGSACAQTPAAPPAPAPTIPAPNPPNAETPPGGVARGVVPPPKGIDPGIIAPPAGTTEPNMPIIKPPAAAR